MIGTKRGWVMPLVIACVVCLLLGITLGFHLGLRIWPRGSPAPAVTLNPTPAEAKKADQVIEVTLRGQGEGHGKKIVPARPRPGGAPGRIDPGEDTTTQEPPQTIVGHSEASSAATATAPPEPGPPGLEVGDQVTGRWAGEAETTVTDARTGRVLDAGTVPLEGTFLATVTAPGELDLKLDFDAPLTLAYRRPRPLFSLRAGVEVDTAGGRSIDVAIGREILDGLTAWAWVKRSLGEDGKTLIGLRMEYRIDVPPF